MQRKPATSLIFLGLLAVLVGCQPEVRVVRSSWDDFPSDPKEAQADSSDAYSDPAGGHGWAIQLNEFTGNDRHQQALDLIERLRKDAVISELWIEDMGNSVRLYQGRYASASEAAIRPALAKAQAIELDGEKPFAKAKLVPLIGQGRVIADPFDLKQFIGYYSLQIGFYDANYGEDFRAAAEQAVRELRQEGYEAYYYHGPYRSMITIGVFSYEQAFVHEGTHDTYAPEIHELQKKFPYNLGNGLTIRQKENGQDIGEQKSSLIRVF